MGSNPAKIVGTSKSSFRFDFKDTWWLECPDFTCDYKKLDADLRRRVNQRKMMVLEQGINDASKKAYRAPLFVIVGMCVLILAGLILEEYTHNTVLMVFLTVGVVIVLVTPVLLFRAYITRFRVEIAILNDLYAKEGYRFDIDGDCNSLTNYGFFTGKSRLLRVIVTLVSGDGSAMV